MVQGEGGEVLRGFNVTFEERTDCLLNDGVDTSLFVLVYLVQTDIVLAILGVAELRHAEEEVRGGGEAQIKGQAKDGTG